MEETKEDFEIKLKALIDDTDKMISDARAYLISQGQIIDLSDWVTIKEYCKRFNIKNTETVINWINRGIIPAENIRIIEEFNNTRFIKAVPYLVKTTKSAVH